MKYTQKSEQYIVKNLRISNSTYPTQKMGIFQELNKSLSYTCQTWYDLTFKFRLIFNLS